MERIDLINLFPINFYDPEILFVPANPTPFLSSRPGSWTDKMFEQFKFRSNIGYLFSTSLRKRCGNFGLFVRVEEAKFLFDAVPQILVGNQKKRIPRNFFARKHTHNWFIRFVRIDDTLNIWVTTVVYIF
jgi:hypothetical protein